MGCTGLGRGGMMFREGEGKAGEVPRPHGQPWSPPSGNPHFVPRAKSVIWIVLCGGVSHLESFDVKPELNKHAGKSIADTPFKAVLDPARINKNIIGGNPNHGNRKVLMPLNAGYKAYGKCGLVVGDWFKRIGEACADDIAVVRSLWTVHNDHGAQLTFQNGRHPREGGGFPTLGSWVSYGLSTLNQNLPEFVVLGQPTGDCSCGSRTYRAGYPGPQYPGGNRDAD